MTVTTRVFVAVLLVLLVAGVVQRSISLVRLRAAMSEADERGWRNPRVRRWILVTWGSSWALLQFYLGTLVLLENDGQSPPVLPLALVSIGLGVSMLLAADGWARWMLQTGFRRFIPFR